MRAKLYIGILSATLLPGFLVQAQIADSRDFRNDEAGLVINNYYDNYDYYYSSRINRFHRSYSVFDYYSPVFTDSYWYSYQPYTWGISIYGGGGFGFGFSSNYPLYYDYGWDYPYYYDRWNYPYFGSSYYQGYDPLYFGGWYSPVVINIRIRNRWPHNYYSWHGRHHWDYDYRPVYNTYNNYYNYPSNNYPSNSNRSRRYGSVNTTNTAGNVSRRELVTGQTNVDRNGKDKTNNGLHLGETRRTSNPSNNTGTSTNVGNRGNNNNADPGNTNNINRSNTGSNNLNSTNRKSDQRMANPNSNAGRTNPSNVQINRRQEQSPVRNQGTISNTSRVNTNTRTKSINTNTNRQVSKSVSSPTVTTRNNKSTGRSVATPSRSSSSAAKSGTKASRSNTSAKSASDKTGSSSSASKSRRK